MGAFDDLIETEPAPVGPGSFADLVPQAPKRTVGPGEAAARGAGSTFAEQGHVLSLSGFGLMKAWDEAAALLERAMFGKNTRVNDQAQAMVAPAVETTKEAVKHYDIKPDEVLPPTSKVANVGSRIVAMVPSMIASGGASAGAQLPMRAAVPNAIRGAVVAQPSFAVPSTINRAEQLLEGGADRDTVLKASVANHLFNTIMGAAPVSASGGLLKRGVTGGAINVGVGIPQRATEAAILGEQNAKLAQPVLGEEHMATDAGIGTVMAMLFGPRSAGARRPARESVTVEGEARQGPTDELRADFATYQDILAANGITDISDPRAATAIERIRQSAARRAERRPGDMPLEEQRTILDEIESGARSPKQAPWVGREAQAPSRVLVDAGGRAAREDDAGARQGLEQARAALSEAQLREVEQATGLTRAEIAGLGPHSQQRLYVNVRERVQQQAERQPDRPFIVADTAPQDAQAGLHSPASKPNVPGERMGDKYGVIQEGAGEVRDARIADETPPISPKAVHEKNRLLRELERLRGQLDAMSGNERYRDLRRRRDVGDRFDEKVGKELDALTKQEERLRRSVYDTEGRIYDVEARSEGGSRTSTGTSDRPFRAAAEGRYTEEQARGFEDTQRERARAEQQADIDRLEAEWRERNRMREERARAGEQQDAFEQQQARGAEADYGKGSKAKFSDKAAKHAEGAPFTTDKYGFVSSDKGGPVRFGHQRDAGWWILRTGNKADTSQVFEIANHPSGSGFTVRVRETKARERAQGGIDNAPAIRTREGGTAPERGGDGGGLPARRREDRQRSAGVDTGRVSDSDGGGVSKAARQRQKGSRFLMRLRRAGGLDPKVAMDLIGERAQYMNRRLPGLSRKGGMSEDALVEWLRENEYLLPHEIDHADKNLPGGSHELARDMLRRAMDGTEEVVNLHEKGDQLAREQEQEADYQRQSGAAHHGIETEGLSRDQIDQRIKEAETREREKETADSLRVEAARRGIDTEGLSRQELEQRIDEAIMDESLRADGLKEEDAADVDLVARAAAIDEQAVERLAMQYPDGGPEFIAEIRRIADGDKGEKAGAGSEAVQRPADEDRTAGGEGRQGDEGSVRARDSAGERQGSDRETRRDGDGFELERPTESELRRRADERDRADEQRRRVEDAPPEDFTLTGSDRPADEGAARGQRGIFDSKADEEAAKLRDEANNVGGKGTTLYSNPVGPVFDFARKLLLKDGGERIAGDLKKSVEAVRGALDGMFQAKPGSEQNLAASLWRTFFFSNQGVLQRLENVTGSAAIRSIRQMFDVDAGRGSAVEQTYHEAVSQSTKRWENRLWDALVTVDKENWPQITRLLQNRHAIRGDTPLHAAARDMAAMLDEIADYAKKSGVDLGDIKDYFPRMLDAMKVLDDPAGFKVAAKRAYEQAGATSAEAKQLADNLHQAIVLGDAGVLQHPFLALNNAMPNANFTKQRKFTKAADDILRDYLIQDPADVLNTYIRKAVRRAEFERRFGGIELNKDGSVKTRTAKWDQLSDALLKEGNANQIPEIVRVVQSMIGEVPSSIGVRGRQAGSWLQALTVMQYLRHAAVTSLPEPFLAAVRTGRGMDVPRTVGGTLWDLSRRAAGALGKGDWFKGTSIDEARQIAEMIGAVETHLSQDSTILLQAGGDIEGSRAARTLANRATFISGLRTWTDATRIGMTKTGMQFLRSLSQDVKAGKKSADFFLRDVGIKDADHAKFAEWVLGEGTTKGKLEDGGAMADQYANALTRLVDGVIMNPGHQDKPRYASHPVGRVAYSLMSYLYAFQQNVVNRTVRMAVRGATEGGLTARERMQMFAPMAYLAALPVAQYALLPLRDALFGDKERRKKKDEPAAKGTVLEPYVPEWVTGSLLEAVSRSAITGAADPLYNMLISAKYERDPATALLGPTGGNWQKLVMDTAKLVTDRNSPKTNTHERQLAADIYNVLVDPLLSMVATRYLTTPAGFGVTQALGVKSTRDRFVDVVAGPEQKRAASNRGSKAAPISGTGR